VLGNVSDHEKAERMIKENLRGEFTKRSVNGF
jgi:hypothetical protein